MNQVDEFYGKIKAKLESEGARIGRWAGSSRRPTNLIEVSIHRQSRWILTDNQKERMESNPNLKATILEVVDNQIKSNDPPETRQTYDRLIKEGFSEKESRELIGIVVSAEIFEVLKTQEPFDLDRFVAALNQLPDTPKN